LRLDRDVEVVTRRGELLDALALERVRRTPRYIRTVYADRYVRVHDEVCTVADDLAYRAVGDSEMERNAAAAHLAELHCALRRVSESPAWQSRTGIATSSLEERLVAARSLLQESMLTAEDTPFVRLYRPYMRSILERAARSLETLRAAGLSERAASAKTAQWTLGGFHLGMIAWTDLEKLATTDFDQVSWGDPEWDLFAFGRTLYEQGKAYALSDVTEIYLRQMDNATLAGLPERMVGYIGFPIATAQVARAYLQSDKRTDDSHADALQHALAKDFPVARGRDAR